MLVYWKKTGTIFSVIKLATPESLIFPNEISNSEQQRLKGKTMNYSTKLLKCKAKKHIVGHITVKKFELANPVCKCSNFVKSLLVAVAPWSLTLTGPNLAGAKSKPHDYYCGHQ